MVVVYIKFSNKIFSSHYTTKVNSWWIIQKLRFLLAIKSKSLGKKILLKSTLRIILFWNKLYVVVKIIFNIQKKSFKHIFLFHCTIFLNLLLNSSEWLVFIHMLLQFAPFCFKLLFYSVKIYIINILTKSSWWKGIKKHFLLRTLKILVIILLLLVSLIRVEDNMKTSVELNKILFLLKKCFLVTLSEIRGSMRESRRPTKLYKDC